MKPLPQVVRSDPLYHEDFSVVLGGPTFQLLCRSHLSDNALGLLWLRVAVLSLFCWLPLLVLSALEGNALGGSTTIPFLRDTEVYTRFLVAIPLLVCAELIVHLRLRFVVRQFLERRLIPEGDMPRFEAAVRSAFRLRNSVPAELLLFVFVYTVGILVIWRQYVAIETSSWYATHGADGAKLTIAGMWFGYVSLPIFQFLMCRWYFRLFIWMRFLWQVSRIDLRLVPTHPDKVGGLSFLSNTVFAFVPLLLAHGALLAGLLANRIFYVGAKLPDFAIDIIVLVAFLTCLVLGPLLVFSPQLAHAKRLGMREYGTLAERYVREFDEKWLRSRAPAREPLLGSGDIQSLADMGSSYDVVQGMRFAPFTNFAVVFLAAATAAPMVPLLLTMMPVEELLKKLMGMLF